MDEVKKESQGAKPEDQSTKFEEVVRFDDLSPKDKARIEEEIAWKVRQELIEEGLITPHTKRESAERAKREMSEFQWAAMHLTDPERSHIVFKKANNAADVESWKDELYRIAFSQTLNTAYKIKALEIYARFILFPKTVTEKNEKISPKSQDKKIEEEYSKKQDKLGAEEMLKQSCILAIEAAKQLKGGDIGSLSTTLKKAFGDVGNRLAEQSSSDAKEKTEALKKNVKLPGEPVGEDSDIDD